MPAASVSLNEALDLTRTGDVWLFRGHTAGDRAIQIATNSPVNHVGMSVVIEDLPPLMWHAELGRSLPDVWSGTRQRGVQLHDLREAVLVWARKYGQRAWLRQLDQPVSREMEDAVLRTIARMDGTPFPSTTRLASQWLARPPGRPARQPDRRPADPGPADPGPADPGPADPGPADRLLCSGPRHHVPVDGAPAGRQTAELV